MTKWIDWPGGRMPVDRSCWVEVRTETWAEFSQFAGALDWTWRDGKHGIIAYRVVTA